jgi:pSer/pThr/pTyr-binding forkhead associated (FHA) protein
MITCHNCQSRQFDGTIFCLECGASLQPRRDPTRPLPPGMGAGELQRPRPVVNANNQAGARITLVVLTTRRRITLDASDELLIGREDTANSIHPDIDLGQHGGYDAGVSRRHAILAYRDGVYHVEDLGSANGTFVNGKRLAPHASAQLATGDELACGTLPLRVELP